MISLLRFKRRGFVYSLILLFVFVSISCSNHENKSNEPSIAFLADVHFHDIYGELQDGDYKGVMNPKNGKYALPRSMKAQLSSTRLFNENYFAFLTALNDIVKRDIKYVILPGDFSDDGQPLNVRGIKQILEEYSKEYGIRFLLITGNHDPVKPFKSEGGKVDFLGQEGKKQAIVSKAIPFKPNDGELSPIISNDLSQLGYKEIANELGAFGFMPQKKDVYWETPFSNYNVDTYSYEQAQRQADFITRSYEVSETGIRLPDVSYLVEPAEGLWFLAIDASIYLPKENAQEASENGDAYTDAIGNYSRTLQHKPYLLKWIKKVTSEAKKRGKKLITFSHYPMLDFNDDSAPLIQQLLGLGKLQLYRSPQDEIGKAFAEAGVRIHFAGHMHINDTGYKRYGEGKGIVNIQVPSLAAYIPGYKIARITGENTMEVNTILLDSIPRFKELFPLYRIEHEVLSKLQDPNIWNISILESQSYRDYTEWHLKELVRMRFLDKDWPVELKDFLISSTGNDIYEFVNNGAQSNENWNAGSNSQWTGYDLIVDFYRLRSADRMALDDIEQERIVQYNILFDAIECNALKSNDELMMQLRLFVTIFRNFMTNVPVHNLLINIDTGEQIIYQ
jgi:3',5'-cyclic AMP phosphodiesterase CpdA